MSNTISNLEQVRKERPDILWNKQVYLSSNAIHLIRYLLDDYFPEPWEVSLIEELRVRISKYE